MITPETDDPDNLEARAELGRAIAAYYAKTDPDVYADAWVLVVHTRKPELERTGTSNVDVVTPDGQAWPMVRGLLDIALTQERAYQADQDDAEEDE